MALQLYNHLVSIPYLRVTHWNVARTPQQIQEFQSPIYGSRTGWGRLVIANFPMFQSPIYGSRTVAVIKVVIKVVMFQSPIYGSRTRIYFWRREKLAGFQSPIYGSRTAKQPVQLNPAVRVSIPYLRVTHHAPTSQKRVRVSSFNPLSTGHAPQ